MSLFSKNSRDHLSCFISWYSFLFDGFFFELAHFVFIFELFREIFDDAFYEAF